MKLSKAQIDALATEFCRKRNAGYEAKLKEVNENRRAIWAKTPDGKLYEKLPKWMKENLRDWAINDQIDKVVGKIKMPTKINHSDVEREIIISSIGASAVKDIQDALEKKFSK